VINIPILNFNQLNNYLHKSNDTIYLVNFWATWCIPCRQEIPAIVAINKKYADKKFKTILVSLDFTNQIQSRLIPFIKANNIQSQVILLNDPNQNTWIDKVDSTWSGGLPFTLIFGKNFREPYTHSFKYNELDSIINLKLRIK
jgi:thiol-disulfide isomerase/thioredoxin